MIAHLEHLHSFILQGESECHVFEAAPSCSVGKKSVQELPSPGQLVCIMFLEQLHVIIPVFTIGDLCYQIHYEEGKHSRPS